MSKLKSLLLSIALCLLSTSFLYGQGCSDSGFCTLNSFKPNSTDSTSLLSNLLKVGTFFGVADHSILAYGSYLEYNKQLNEKFGLETRLTSLAQSGNEISVVGLSDIYLTASYRASQKIKLTMGTKIPLSSANKSYNNLPLPMDYQSSLGTFDLIIGVGYEIENLQFVAAIQQPLMQNNNEFLATNYPLESELSAIQSTNKFERSGDVLLRISYPVLLNSKLKLTPSLLPIYHLANDKFTDEFNVKQEIKGSQGLTINGNTYLDYEINSKNYIQFNMGVPFIVREVRPDGLTRGVVVNLEYRVKF